MKPTLPTAEQAPPRLDQQPALGRRRPQLHRRGRGPPARHRARRAFAGQARRGEVVEVAAPRGFRQRARRAHRQPGDAAGQGRVEGDLPQRLAGRRRRQPRRRDVSRPVAVPGELGAAGGQAHQQHAVARGPAPPRGRRRFHRLPAADRRRRGGGLRRRAQCVRADEGDDRGRRRRRALRGPAARQRQSVGTWAARCWCPRARRWRSSTPRAWPPT